VRDADRIAVLEAGRVVESGSYAELLRRGGRFARLVEIQHRGLGTAEALDADAHA
jgi:ABC-type multidrug transport system fused ATPase/permease subunit